MTRRLRKVNTKPVRYGKPHIEVRVKRSLLCKLVTFTVPVARHIPFVRAVMRFIILRGTKVSVGNAPWQRLGKRCR